MFKEIWLFECTNNKRMKFHIQDVLGRTVNVWERVMSVVLSEKKVSLEHVCNFECLRRYGCLNLLKQKHCEW